MRHPLFAAAHILGMASASAVWSADDDCHVRMADRQPRSRVLQLAEQNDWQVFLIKTGDGCYQIRARDSRGRVIEVTLDPATLEVDGRIVFGATLDLEDLEDGTKFTYQIVGDDEADIDAGFSGSDFGKIKVSELSGWIAMLFSRNDG